VLTVSALHRDLRDRLLISHVLAELRGEISESTAYQGIQLSLTLGGAIAEPHIRTAVLMQI